MTDDELRVKHLEMIQAIVARLAQNSFLLKGWAATLVGVLVVLGNRSAEPRFAILAVMPCLAFWALDGYYLALERRYRALYDDVRESPGTANFGMAIDPRRHPWRSGVLAGTVWPYYFIVAGLAVVVAALPGSPRP